ncbi:MAG: hypothetical protein AB7H96_11960 [Vicinamibacterales bacterium]
MAHFSADVRLRPIRFGFVVKPDDAESLRRVFRVNTCLWGGKFNPIIPFLRAVPKWWDRHGYRFETAAQITNGYLDFFEPDFLVESKPGIASALGYEPKRVIPLDDVLQREGDSHKEGHGESVMALYRDRYLKEFQFTRRHPHDIVDIVAADASFADAASCLFGGFPSEPGLEYFAQAFKDAFDPRPIQLTGATLAEFYETGGTSALRIGHGDIEVDSHGWHDPALFVFDAHSPHDLMDVWNLRAVRRDVLPVPMQWLPVLSPFCRQFITRNFRPLPHNPHGVMIRVTAMFGRAIPRDAIEPLFREHLQVPLEGANVLQDFYPDWRPRSLHGPRDRRPILNAKHDTFSSESDGDAATARFEHLTPSWADRFGADRRWANVVKLSDWSFKDLAATVFPNERGSAFLPRLGIGGQERFATTEGIVVFPKFVGYSEHWELPTGSAAIAEWLKTSGLESTASDAGRATEQVIQTIGGFNRVGDLAKKGILETLNDMARTPVTHSAHSQKFRNQVQRAVRGDIWRDRSFNTLVERGVVQLGLEVRCTNCATWSWFALDELDYKLPCALCRRSFGFPITDPGTSDKARWAYRVVGPFALPDFARGAYAAALALRSFAQVIGGHRDGSTTWCAGRELVLGPNAKIEADFIIWYQRRALITHDQDAPTDVVFGEAKSFGKDAFKPEDVDNMKAIAQRFPGSVITFATLREPSQITEAEVAAIRKLALWGREYLPGRRRTRAPVVVLTGLELFAGFSLPNTWKEAGGRHAIFGDGWRTETSNLRTLADITQQLYLNLPSYSQWHETKWKAIHARRKARADAKPKKETVLR